jgi:hypothetical protein
MLIRLALATKEDRDDVELAAAEEVAQSDELGLVVLRLVLVVPALDHVRGDH